MSTTYLAQADAGNPTLNLAVFVGFIVVTMGVVVLAGRHTQNTASSFYTGGASFSATQNGIAIAGDYLSAAAFLGVVGAIALSGYDGFLYSIGYFVAWLVALLLVAEPLRNTGRYTMAEVLSFRLRQRPVRMAACVATLLVSLLYLVAQMAGAGALVSVLLDIQDQTAQAMVIAVVGTVMTLYVLIGGMRGTTYVQIIKAVLLCSSVVLIAILIAVIVKGNLSELLRLAVEKHGDASVLEPGSIYGVNELSKIDFVSLAITLPLGVAGLPHVLMRFYTVPTATAARTSVAWAIALIGGFYALTLLLGFGAAALVGPERIAAAPGGPNAAAPLLALELGGPIFMAIISAIAFATVLAVVAGLAITASASVARDFYDSVIRRGESTEAEQVRVSKITVVVIGIAATVLGIGAMNQNVAFLVSLAFCIAAAANLPTILYSLYWRRFTTTGAVSSMITGLSVSLVLIVLSPVVSGRETSILPDLDFAFFPLANPGLVAIPAGFIAGIVGTLLSKPERDPALQSEMEVRSLTGIGVEKPIAH
ncbi:solute symporter family protein [Corynebacterium otitidis]|uniref:solute symporter family protein n=1 Tax=Corynebacterium otitidis TaxID=29321 RepID=UPI000627A2D1|nr:cation acetate symporter [Corynebacterium otitidis]KKO83493.1 acetate permease [Corynebacterium otitidis]